MDVVGVAHMSLELCARDVEQFMSVAERMLLQMLSQMLSQMLAQML